MNTEDITTAVVLDVGSTNARAWWIERDEIVRRETAPVGVRDAARTGSTRVVHDGVRDLLAAVCRGERPDARLAAGMITSPLGVADVPHVKAPAGLDDLARGSSVIEAPDIVDGPLVLFPGVRTPGADEDAPLSQDVMRGEEAMVIGLLAKGTLSRGDALLNVSSHWKLIKTDGAGRVAGSRTSLGGEVVHVVQTGTVLAASLPEGPFEDVDAGWIARGAAASRREGLLRALFGVRLLDLDGGTTKPQRFAWMLGACIACDLDALHASGALAPDVPVRLTGPGAVPEAWALVLAGAGHAASIVPPPDAEGAFIAGVLAMERSRRVLTAPGATS